MADKKTNLESSVMSDVYQAPDSLSSALYVCVGGWVSECVFIENED